MESVHYVGIHQSMLKAALNPLLCSYFFYYFFVAEWCCFCTGDGSIFAMVPTIENLEQAVIILSRPNLVSCYLRCPECSADNIFYTISTFGNCWSLVTGQRRNYLVSLSSDSILEASDPVSVSEVVKHDVFYRIVTIECLRDVGCDSYS